MVLSIDGNIEQVGQNGECVSMYLVSKASYSLVMQKEGQHIRTSNCKAHVHPHLHKLKFRCQLGSILRRSGSKREAKEQRIEPHLYHLRVFFLPGQSLQVKASLTLFVPLRHVTSVCCYCPVHVWVTMFSVWLVHSKSSVANVVWRLTLYI